METDYSLNSTIERKISQPLLDKMIGKEKEKQYFTRGYRIPPSTQQSNNNGTQTLTNTTAAGTVAGSMSRLTTIIRRSLRLKPKRPQPTNNLEGSQKKRMTFRKIFDDKEGSSFTDYSKVKIHKTKEDYGRLDTLEQYQRQNKNKDVSFI
uniref:Uncharacterized protein n=1 Tax=Parastrongyloides trichosuri TaxID=131310 RepID=A0A0N4ZRA1_PARTI